MQSFMSRDTSLLTWRKVPWAGAWLFDTPLYFNTVCSEAKGFITEKFLIGLDEITKDLRKMMQYGINEADTIVLDIHGPATQKDSPLKYLGKIFWRL